QLIPLLTTLLSALLGRESLNPLTPLGLSKWLCILTAASGAYIIILSTVPTPDPSPPTAPPSPTPYFLLGNLGLFLNCLLFAGYLHLQAPLRARGHPAIRLSAWAHLGGIFWNTLAIVVALGLGWTTPGDLLPPLRTAPSTPVAVPSEDIPPGWTPYLLESLPAILYAALLSSATAYTLITWASGKVSPPVVAVFVPLQPVTAAVVQAKVVGNGRIGWVEVVGAGVVVVGVTVLVWVRWVEEGRGRRVDEEVRVGAGEGEEEEEGERQPLLRS
ncbi:hypothetical protein HDU96_000575, partial [Phlyctochytrium bullatum]